MIAKRLFILSGILMTAGILLYAVISGIKNVKVDDFKPAAVMFLIDSSASNQKNIELQKKFIKQICQTMDPEDAVKIIRVSEEAYLIYEGSPHNVNGITKSLNSFTRFSPEDVGTAYGSAVKKAVSYSLTMKKEGYIPAIVVIGDLENEGQTSKQLNWDTLPENIKNTKKYIPDLSMMFVWAHPSKLDFVKEKLNPVLGEDHLIVATDQTVDKVSRKFFKSLGR